MKLKKSINILSLVISILSLFAASYGVLSSHNYGSGKFASITGEVIRLYGRGIYHNDSVSIAAQAISQDVITIILAIPLLLISLYYTNKGLMKGKLILTGTLGYFFYTYTSYTFLSMYNKLFLVYIILMSTSFFALTIMITSFNLKNIKYSFNNEMPRKFVGGLLMFMAIMIGLMWIGKIFPSVLKDVYPEGLEHYTTLTIQALDLGFVVPISIFAGWQFIMSKPIGYLLTPIMIIKEISLLTALSAMIVGQILAGVKMNLVQIIIFPSFNILIIFCLIMIIKNVKEHPLEEEV